MTSQHVDTLIIGAGQAGLSTAYHLQRLGIECLVLDGNDRIGDNWRQHYDSLKLYSPARYDGLPGMPFPGDPWHYPHRDEVADYLEQYAIKFDLPVRMSTKVDRLIAEPGGGYLATIGDETIWCDNVVVASGPFGRTPYVPSFANQLSPTIRQLHSSDYKNPGDLADGPVLVVGASHSGTDIAYEIAQTHATTLCGRDTGQIPVPWETWKTRLALPVIVFAWKHILTRRTPIGRKVMSEIRAHGGPMLRVKRADLARRGVQRQTLRVTGVVDGKPALADGTVLDVANVVWATGFQQVFDWLEVPVVGDDGWPREYRGVVADAPGLFFCGISFQFGFASMTFVGIGRDSEFVPGAIAKRRSRARIAV
jgi:putative flavoprotein involved in K+ transport